MEMGGNLCQILELGGTTIKGRRVISYILELQRKAESYYQHTKSTFSSDTRQSMKRRITAKHNTGFWVFI